MRKTITTIASGVLVCLVSLPSWGLGFGRLINGTTLGQPLDITIELASDPSEFVAADCVSADVIAGESTIAPQAVRTRLTTSPGGGGRAIHVATVDSIQEPVVTLTVFAGCPTRVSRQFVVFVDPPTVPLEAIASTSNVEARANPHTESRAAQQSGADSGGTTVATGGETLAPPAQPATAASAVPAPARSASKPKPRGEASVPAAAEKQSTDSQPPPAPRAAPRVAEKPLRERSAPRLELERAPPPTSTATQAPANAASAVALVAAQAAAASAVEASQRAADAQRESIVALQQRLERLQAESDTTNKGIAQLQARLKQAEAAREFGLFEYSLIFGGGALLLLIGLFLGRRSAAVPGTPWWNAAGTAEPAGTDAVASGVPIVDSAVTGSAPLRSNSAAAGTRGGAHAAAGSGASVQGLERFASAPAPVVTEEHTAPARFDPAARWPAELVDNVPAEEGSAAPLTADQLIDLEQQAEFFIVLGQEDSAVDLLDSRLRSGAGQSPLPLLKLLQIHRRRGERDAFDRARDRFERRFGEGAPTWEDGATSGPGLDSHEDIVSRIAAVWATPDEALLLIESYLVHRERPKTPLRLAAFSDLQFLYLLARSLRDEGGTPDALVDLLLPIGSRTEATVVLAAPIKPPATSDSSEQRVDVELDFDALLPPKSPS
jgi:hypothetical protein